MKRYFYLLGMAVAALSSCTNEELIDVAENRAIKFEQFVENNTKAVSEVTSLTNFYVFGEFGDAAGTYGTKIHNNEPQTATYYWQAGKYYSFGAYADGENGKINNASFDANKGTLTFTGYTPNDTKDLVAAVAKQQAPTNMTDKVPLTFKHMLSQVKFTFNTTDGDAYTLAISNIKFNAINKATGVYPQNNDQVAWTEVSKGDYTYTQAIDDVANAANNNTASSESKLVIPQSGTDKLNVTFTAKITGPGMPAEGKTANFTATLAVTENAAGTTSAANTWVPGYRYNYTAEINAEKIYGPDEQIHKIEFKPTVEAWANAAEQTTTPSKQDQPKP